MVCTMYASHIVTVAYLYMQPKQAAMREGHCQLNRNARVSVAQHYHRTAKLCMTKTTNSPQMSNADPLLPRTTLTWRCDWDNSGARAL